MGDNYDDCHTNDSEYTHNDYYPIYEMDSPYHNNIYGEDSLSYAFDQFGLAEGENNQVEAENEDEDDENANECEYENEDGQHTITRLDSRTGRENQRYNNYGKRKVVGGVPYRYNENNELQVLLISAKNKEGWYLFPKGGWETDESNVRGVAREALEEAGVYCEVENILFEGDVKSVAKNGEDEIKDVTMYALRVGELVPDHMWAEGNKRTREWMSVAKAHNKLYYDYMKHALEQLIVNLSSAGGSCAEESESW